MGDRYRSIAKRMDVAYRSDLGGLPLRAADLPAAHRCALARTGTVPPILRKGGSLDNCQTLVCNPVIHRLQISTAARIVATHLLLPKAPNTPIPVGIPNPTT